MRFVQSRMRNCAFQKSQSWRRQCEITWKIYINIILASKVFAIFSYPSLSLKNWVSFLCEIATDTCAFLIYQNTEKECNFATSFWHPNAETPWASGDPWPGLCLWTLLGLNPIPRSPWMCIPKFPLKCSVGQAKAIVQPIVYLPGLGDQLLRKSWYNFWNINAFRSYYMS